MGTDHPVPTRADLLRDISEPLLPGRLIKKYDKNHDRKLTSDELGWEPERVKMLDRNSDGKERNAEGTDERHRRSLQNWPRRVNAARLQH